MLTFNFTPFPALTTARLTLREPRLDDADALFKIRSNPAVMNVIPRPVAQTSADAKTILQLMLDGLARHESINWALTRTADDELIGMIGYVRTNPEHHRAEIGYILRADCHGQGLMTEALDAAIAYGFAAMRLHSIVALIRADNAPSRKLVERHGFRQEGLFREDCFFDDRYFDSAVYARLAPK